MKTIYTIILCTLLIACHKDKGESELRRINIDLSQSQPTKLSSFVDSVNFVKLHQPNLALGEGLIKIESDIIFYWDFTQHTISLFDLSGRHISTLNKRGNGPDEYNLISQFFIDTLNNTLEIWDSNSNNIIVYSYPDFNVKKTIVNKLQLTFTSGIKLDTITYLLSANQARNIIDGNYTNADYFLYNLGSEKINYFFHRLYKNETSPNIIRYSLFPFKLISNEQSEIFASVNYDNTIYTFENGRFEPYAIVNYINGRYVDNEKMLKMSKEEHLDYFVRSSDFIDRASFPNIEVNNKKLLLINYIYRTELHGKLHYRHYLQLKDSGKDFNISKIENDITDFPDEIILGTTNFQNYIHLHPYYKNNLLSVTLDSLETPVIIFMKIKEEN